MSALTEKDFDRFVVLHRAATGGSKPSVNVFEIGMAGKQIRIRHGMKGKKWAKTVAKKASIIEARNTFNDKKRQKLAEGYRIVREKEPRPLNSNSNNSANNNNLHSKQNANGNNSGFASIRPFSFSFGQSHRPQQLQQSKMHQQRGMAKENHQTNGLANNYNGGDSDDASNISETSSVHRRKQAAPKRHHKPKKDGNIPANHINRKRKGVNNKKGKNKNVNQKGNNKNKGKNKKGNKKKGKNKNKNNNKNQNIANGTIDTNDENEDTSEAEVTSADNGDEYYTDENDDERSSEYEHSNHYMNGKSRHHASDEDEDDDEDETEIDDDDEEDVDDDENEAMMNGHGGPNNNRGKNNQVNNNIRRNNNNNNNINNRGGSEEEEEEDEDDDDDNSDSSSSSSSSSGRSSDDEYEMEYEKMAKIMADIVSREPPKRLVWKPLSMWIRYNEEIDYHAEWALAPMPRRIAGSCHELLVAYFKSSKGEFLTRLIKLARDPDEDNKHHFETERKVSQYLTKMAKVVNKCYHTRNDVCIWPVETIYFEYEDEMKWATVQAPFLPKDNYVFVKIEPNYGKPCVNDPIVGRYQHAFAAISKGLDLVRDWQGYGVSQKVFLKQCEITNVKEAIEQIVERKNGGNNTQVLVVIDPVLTTCGAHYETNNPTDFGMKAIDEWLETHDCDKCRCEYFYLTKELRFGIADPQQKWFDWQNAPKYLKQYVRQCRKDLNIWQGDPQTDGWQPPLCLEQKEDENYNDNENENNNNNSTTQKTKSTNYTKNNNMNGTASNGSVTTTNNINK